MATAPTKEQIEQAPKVLLHDHLDGGLRPRTVVELAERTGYRQLPATDPTELAKWFAGATEANSLEEYLERFAHTVGVLQTPEALTRVAAECAEDLAADGVVYAEVRYAPELSTQGGMELDEVVEAILEGFRQGTDRAAAAGNRIRVGLLLCAMRQESRSSEIARLAVRYRDSGVVGFDIAGPEAGHPPTQSLEAFEYLRRENFHFTIHAGEGFGLPSIWEAIQYCGAARLGHGVRILDDITFDANGQARLGRLASFVRDRRIPLEMCPRSNVHTSTVNSLAEHPIALLRQLHFRVTVNTDNRLISQTSTSREFTELVDHFGYTLDDLQWFTVNAMKSAFLPFNQRLALINEVIKPGYAALRSESLFGRVDDSAGPVPTGRL
ncbi:MULTISPECIES: adenosine deaminase [unclassified Actinopolyspora]|uniref:adenosine deaminase n=1 Tax=Actinopolyspora TaxID=1849 RepID=UPI0013F5CAA6|nr:MULTISPECIES: adenosine deaminase [unclassified Actinopolyspora]NHD15786.1 adenosine deaminase [Actinopolyspora sp. BKK2]NHE75000.1 adenosine deaminase [Actinopolyspora sp. BKK1]